MLMLAWYYHCQLTGTLNCCRVRIHNILKLHFCIFPSFTFHVIHKTPYLIIPIPVLFSKLSDYRSPECFNHHEILYVTVRYVTQMEAGDPIPPYADGFPKKSKRSHSDKWASQNRNSVCLCLCVVKEARLIDWDPLFIKFFLIWNYGCLA